MPGKAQRQWDQVFESLDDLAHSIYRNYMNGNKSDARLSFNACPPARRGYLAYAIICLHVVNGGHVADLDDFFKSVSV